MKTVHFITGLPRSGSTLLASILLQNPRFHASIQSPLGQIITDMVGGMGPRNESASFLSIGQRERMVEAAVDAYYENCGRAVIFDNNRRWAANASMCAQVWPDSYMIACVRDPRAIVDSFERVFQANPLDLSVIHGGMPNTTVYNRVGELLKDTGVLGFSLAALRSAYYGPCRSRLLLVEYDNLARFPGETMADIYKVLGEEKFDHDFGRILPIPGAAEFDKSLSTPGLHALKPTVVFEERQSILPPDLLAAIPVPFWRSNGPVTSGG